jgi:hypothetical protein
MLDIQLYACSHVCRTLLCTSRQLTALLPSHVPESAVPATHRRRLCRSRPPAAPRRQHQARRPGNRVPVLLGRPAQRMHLQRRSSARDAAAVQLRRDEDKDARAAEGGGG